MSKIEAIAKRFLDSRAFMPFGERFIHLLRPFIENGREESNVLERYKEHLFQVGRRTSVPVDSKTEEKVVLDLLKQVSALVEWGCGGSAILSLCQRS